MHTPHSTESTRRGATSWPGLDLRDDELIVDSFAGGGGASEGIEQATGRDIDIAINHNGAALAIHAANHPRTRHIVEDIWACDPAVLCAGRRVGLLWLSPDCFPAGTLVLTTQGYRPIESVEVGDLVLTHKGRWRRVTSTMTSEKPLVVLKGMGHPGLAVSAEHPFYARQRTSRKGSPRTLAPAAWTRAKDLDRDWYWSSHTRFPPLPIPPVPVVHNRTMTVTADLLWLAGRYVADGWSRIDDKRAELVITTGHPKAATFRERMLAFAREGDRARDDELSWTERDTRTARQFSTTHRALVGWLREQFGHLAEHKYIPSWVLGLSDDLRRAFLDGYMAGDGCVVHGDGNPITQASTVSKALAFSLQAMASTFGYDVSVYTSEGGTGIIEGRRVNVKRLWAIRWRTGADPDHRQAVVEDGLRWQPIRSREETHTVAPVYNLSVEEDESYTVEGVIGHNCTHHSRAKGGKPLNRRVRGLAWAAVRWIKAVRPRVICLENVQEFMFWGPLGPDKKPVKARAGETFKAFVAKLRRYGYVVEWRLLVAADYGAPTTRKRLFLVARNDGVPIAWPEPTHGAGREQPWRAASEIIDWQLPCPSIFDRKRPLKPATLRRIAEGLRRYVFDNPNPFLIKFHGDHGGRRDGAARGQATADPLRTVDRSNRFGLVVPHVMTNTTGHAPRDAQDPLATVTTGDHHYVCAPQVQPVDAGATVPLVVPITHTTGGNQARSGEAPLATVTTAKGGEFMLATPHLALVGPSAPSAEGEGLVMRTDMHKSNALCVHPPSDPLHTVTSGGGFAVLTPVLMPATHPMDDRTHDARDPLRTVTGAHRGELMLAAGTLLPSGYGEREGQTPRTLDPAQPLTTVVACGQKQAAVLGFLSKHYGNGVYAQDTDKPLGAVTVREHFTASTAYVTKFYGTSTGSGADEPLPTVTSGGDKGGGHLAEVRAFLMAYYSSTRRGDVRRKGKKGAKGRNGKSYQQQSLFDPLHTVTNKARFGLVTIQGQDYQLVDIGLRMLEPKELFGAQGFPADYVIAPKVPSPTKKHPQRRKALTKTAQIAAAGNSVCPQVACALVRAQFTRRDQHAAA